MDLNSVMEFDCVVRVQDGTVTREAGTLHPPSLAWYGDTHHLDSDGTWSLLAGYSGQSSSAGRYMGPIMHVSEYIGGRLADDIVARDGYYVALTCECPDEDDDEPAGWAVAYRPA